MVGERKKFLRHAHFVLAKPGIGGGARLFDYEKEHKICSLVIRLNLAL
jgi:hypothetical protein